MPELIYRGRAIGVRVAHNGERKWVGSVTHECEHCSGKPEMCGRCRAEAELKAHDAADRWMRVNVWKRESAEDFASRWTEDYGTGGRWDASTLRSYADPLKSFKARFGSTALADITPTSARAWAGTVPQSYVRTIRAMLNDAMADELIDRNPFAKLKLEPQKGRSEIVAITEEELHLLCDLAGSVHGSHGATVAAMIAVAGYTAIRPGELYAIEADALHPERQELDVRHQWNGVELKRPKSKKPRTVVLPPETAPYLDALPSYIGGVQVKRASGERVDYRPVFRHKKSGLYQQSTFSMTWGTVRTAFEAKLSPARARELRDARDGKPMNFYELRHFGCTEILRRGGSLEDAAHQLGHKEGDTKLVARVYGHLEEGVKLDRIKALYGGNVRDLRSVESEAADG